MEFARREILYGLMATVGVTGAVAPMEDGYETSLKRHAVMAWRA